MNSLASFALVCAVAGSAMAVPARLDINQAQSSVTVQLTILGGSATDSSQVTGFYDLDFNNPTAPTQVSLIDFQAALVDDLVLNINLFPLGRFNSNVNDLAIFYADAPAPFGPTPIVANQFTFAGLPILATGTLAYTATGFVCTQLQSSGELCVDTIDLSEQPATAQTLTASLALSNGVATVTASIDSTQPLDPNNPALGSIRITGTIVASGAISCPADFNSDGIVDFFDYLDFVDAFAINAPAADFNDDGIVDFFDYLDFVDAFASGC